MLLTILILSFYSNSYTKIALRRYFTFFPELAYGYKKKAKIRLSLINSSTNIVFGLATKKEMKNIKSMNSCHQYCDGKEKISKIQLFSGKDQFVNANLTIEDKSILTPFVIPCNELYEFSIKLDILNGKNHLDYRYESTMNFIISYIVILLVSIIISIFVIFKTKKEIKSYLQILIFILLSICQMIPLYLEFSSNKNNEFIIEKKKCEYAYYFLTSCKLINLILLNIFNDSVRYLYYKFNIFWPFLILTIIGITLIIIILIINMSIFNYTTFFVCSLFHFIVILSSAYTPSILSPTKIGIILYVCSCFFTFADKPSFLSFSEKIGQKGVYLMNLDIVDAVCSFVSLILFSLDYFWLNKKCNDIDIIEQQDPKQLELNHELNEQIEDLIKSVNSQIDQD